MTDHAKIYNLSIDDADFLKGVVLLPADLRRKRLDEYREVHGWPALLDLFVQYIGLANAVEGNTREAMDFFTVVHGIAHPDRAEDRINLPTVLGALHGVELAALCVSERPCGSCAFRLGTWANQSLITTEDANYSLDGDTQFQCHESDAKHKPVCRGYAAVLALKREVQRDEGTSVPPDAGRGPGTTRTAVAT